ncbi:outer membrane protein assembly factor BamB family protein [Spirochaeta dissipatitropha]
MKKRRSAITGLSIALLLGILNSCPLTPPVQDDNIWTIRSNSPITSTAVKFGDHILAVSFHGQLFCIAPKTGRIQWEFEIGDRVIFSPIVQGNKIFVHTATDAVVKIDASSSKPRKLWSSADLPGQEARTPSQPIDIVGNTIYRYNSIYFRLSSFNANDGSLIMDQSVKPTPEEDDLWELSASAIPVEDFDYLISENQTILHLYKNGQLINRLETEFHAWYDTPATSEPYTRYKTYTDAFAYNGKAWFLVEVTDWEPEEPEDEEEENDYDDEYTQRFKRVGDPRLVLYELRADGIDFDTIDREYQLPDDETSFPVYWGSYTQHENYIQFQDNILDNSWSFRFMERDLSITRYRLDDMSIQFFTIPRQLLSGAVWYDTIASYEAKNGDLLLHIGQKKDYDSLDPIEYFLYRLPAFFSHHSPDPPQAERLHRLQPGTIAPGLMTDDYFIISYRDNTIRAYEHNSGPIISSSRAIPGDQK